MSGNTARGGTVTIAENGLGVSYVPPPGQTGSDIAKYIACDQDGACGEAFILITIVDEQSSNRRRRRHLRKDSDVQQQHDHSRSSHGHGPSNNAALIAALLDALGGDNNVQIIINTNSGNTQTTTNNDNSNSKCIVCVCFVHMMWSPACHGSAHSIFSLLYLLFSHSTTGDNDNSVSNTDNSVVNSNTNSFNNINVNEGELQPVKPTTKPEELPTQSPSLVSIGIDFTSYNVPY